LTVHAIRHVLTPKHIEILQARAISLVLFPRKESTMLRFYIPLDTDTVWVISETFFPANLLAWYQIPDKSDNLISNTVYVYVRFYNLVI